MLSAQRTRRIGARLGLLLAALVLVTAACATTEAQANATAALELPPSVAPTGAPRAAAAGSADLAARERAASLVLARARTRFLARYADDPDRPFTTTFRSFRRELRRSALFRTLRAMPKGGLLHVHATGIGTAEWVVRRAFTEPHTYVYWGPASQTWVRGQLMVFPQDDAPAGFVPAAEFERTVTHPRRTLLRLITFGPEDESVTDIWREFEAVFQRMDAFVSHRPVFVDYYRHSFFVLARDGVQFVEIHTGMDALTLPDGGTTEDLGVLAAYRRALAGVRARYPGFGLRIILCTWRGATLEQAAGQLARQRALKAAAPGILHGFDIVGDEHGGNTNGFYAPVLTTLPHVPLYLHAGESLSAADTNVEEALDLGALRIGHGLNMDLFPGLEKRVCEAGVTLEVCPISNQELRYVPDLRRHPARGWLRRGAQVTLGSDDPSIFGSRGLSDDFAMAYLSWRLSLSDLKRVALRSITSSTLAPERRARQRALFERRWDRWVTEVAAGRLR